MGVSGCDQQLLRTIAQTTGGMFVMANQITDLSLFFIQQFLIVVCIIHVSHSVGFIDQLDICKMIKELDNLLNRELLRAFLEEQLHSSIDDETLDLLIFMLSHMVKTGIC